MALIQFDSQISLGNLLTMLVMLAGGAKAYYSIGQTTSKSAGQIEELTRRINLADLERIKVCVDTMWLFQLRRGVAEIEEKGLGRSNSPVQLTRKANELMRPFLPELRHFYTKVEGEKLGLVELTIALEQELGARLAAEVCRKVGITDGACLVLAIGQLRPIGPEELREALEQCQDASDLKGRAMQYLANEKPK